MLFVLKSYTALCLLYVKSNECRSALRKLQHSSPYNSIGKHLDLNHYLRGQIQQLTKYTVDRTKE